MDSANASLDNGGDSTNNFIQLDILMGKKNTTTNNVTKGKISAQVKELTQESFDAFIYSAVTNAIIGIIFITFDQMAIAQ